MAQRELIWPPPQARGKRHAETPTGKRKPGPIVRQASAAPKPVPPPGKRPVPNFGPVSGHRADRAHREKDGMLVEKIDRLACPFG